MRHGFWQAGRFRYGLIRLWVCLLYTSSVGFALYDLNANIRTVVALDRLRECPFTNGELYGLQLFVNIINQMHKNFYNQGNGLRNIRQAAWQEARLTARELSLIHIYSRGGR